MIDKMLDIFPSSWEKPLENVTKIQNFNNLQEFKQYVKIIEGEDNVYCGCTYKEALNDLLHNKSTLKETEYIKIRKDVESKLIKRGLITDYCYEDFKYSSDGVVIDVDVTKYINNEPDCIITPNTKYVSFFYELYINISYPYNVKDKDIAYRLSQICSVLDLLEKEKVFVKVNTVIGSKDVTPSGDTYFSVLPLFSHNDRKDPYLLSSVINNRLLRKFYFSIFNDVFTTVSYNKGFVVPLPDTLSLYDPFDPADFYLQIKEAVHG